MSKLVSVIVPIYKVEPYLDQCIESIVNQTYKNFELILVDDGSPDNCGKICDEWAQRDKRIVVIHKENGGVSSSRNAGVAAARGEMLSFIDSDDYVDPKFLELLTEQMYFSDCDIVECHSVNFDDGTVPVPFYSDALVTLTPYHWLTESGVGELLPCVLWNKLYRKHLFDDIIFPVGRNYEDEATLYKLVYRANKVVRMESVLYFYRQRLNSITGSPKNLKAVEQQFLALEEKSLFFDQMREPEIANFSYAKLAIHMVSNNSFRMEHTETPTNWYPYIKTIFFRIIKSPIVPIKYKIYIFAFLVCPYLFH